MNRKALYLIHWFAARNYENVIIDWLHRTRPNELCFCESGNKLPDILQIFAVTMPERLRQICFKMDAWSDNSICQLRPDTSAVTAVLIKPVLRVSEETGTNMQSISCKPKY